jgi:hypothetical protein
MSRRSGHFQAKPARSRALRVSLGNSAPADGSGISSLSRGIFSSLFEPCSGLKQGRSAFSDRSALELDNTRHWAAPGADRRAPPVPAKQQPLSAMLRAAGATG